MLARFTIGHHRSKRMQAGLMLSEIATIMVLIALLICGILKTDEMVTQAKIKKVLANFSGISAAYDSYVDRYNAIPGDDPNAESRWPGATSGNGDGYVSGLYNSTNPADESRLWWDDLRRAGLVAGPGTSQPLDVAGGLVGVQTGDGVASTYGAVLGSNATGAGGLHTLVVCSANLPDRIAVSVDTQMDDGSPASGTMRGQMQRALDPPIGKQAPEAYAETGATMYTLCRALSKAPQIVLR